MQKLNHMGILCGIMQMFTAVSLCSSMEMQIPIAMRVLNPRLAEMSLSS